ncbi:MAG: YhcH/YjgK/YiaL family protein [Thermodesulfobacteriota bacterium]|nr:YhcH/YjgK/YiaL family protein [Thermodesulfobacteriota bacterium]
MIFDTIVNIARYPYGSAWQRAFAFLASLTHETEDNEYSIQGDKMLARVMSYPTKNPVDAVLETHRKYIDIQAVLRGNEMIEWFPASTLRVDKPYRESTDVEFYVHPGRPPAQMFLAPGNFAVFFPEDAHMPGLSINGKSEIVKKAVIKISVDLLTA